MHKSKTAKRNYIRYGIIAVLLFALLVTVYVKRDSVKDVFSDETPAQTSVSSNSSDNPLVNNVNYGPSTPSDNDQINEQKKNADLPVDKPVNTGLTATITNTRVVDSKAQVSVLIGGTTSGTCALTLSKSGASDIQKSVSIIVRNGIATCEDFNIPVSSLSGGNWTVGVVILSAAANSKPAVGTLQVGS